MESFQEIADAFPPVLRVEIQSMITRQKSGCPERLLIRIHKDLRMKELLVNELTQVPGIGFKRRNVLASNYRANDTWASNWYQLYLPLTTDPEKLLSYKVIHYEVYFGIMMNISRDHHTLFTRANIRALREWVAGGILLLRVTYKPRSGDCSGEMSFERSSWI
jgi:hypothetical protein